ncbi:MAG: tRNA (adenosine(37)-N6)-threonylcarbamoyltransferase complex transferase subunit TsaD [Dehalococcoidales bacterium]|jgi:N6-L-threonylcarbamoyladenine synthase|nr:tRNA (adenosine(37)-N6)-threonylcarbamoyltransferase complex transferase subunit TsaD [Dehalococcoidales bacterium]MDP6577299.1 tRNA (adenosine(37)-N6)-threonylcarbamoyltransferase complex transferase subunit TsaD [Dehalococcoidales bacterium]
MLVLGIETSCDETSSALVIDSQVVLSNFIATQLDLLRKYGGVVPEIAARRHAELIGYVINEAVTSAGKILTDVEAIAVTSKQGLIGCLLVGVAAAKSLSYVLRVPLLGVHHIEGHIFANLLSNPRLPMPHICLTVSGGHTMLVYVRDYCQYELLGSTLDDAAGEAFDKIAKFLDLGFPGGPVIDKLATRGNRKAYNFPRPLLKAGTLDFSFSGLKTAIINAFKHRLAGGAVLPLEDIAASFQEAVVDVLVAKTWRAARQRRVSAVSVTGGVSANRRLREVFRETCQMEGIEVFFPELPLCTDNAAMIAAAGYARFRRGEVADLNLNVFPNVPFEV